MSIEERIDRILPLIRSNDISDDEVQRLIDGVREAIKGEPSKAKTLGGLIAQMKQAQKKRPTPSNLKWVAVSKGFLAIGHRPGKKMSFDDLENGSTSAVLTLLQSNEGASSIGAHLNKHGIEWIWFPFSANASDGEEVRAQVIALYEKLEDRLLSGARIYIHCSAGIHRTGMIAYGVLRYLGNDSQQAFLILQNLREVTAAQIGEDRLAWGDQFGR